MFEEIADAIPCPEWVTLGGRYHNLLINELWLTGNFYSHIDQPFGKETDNRGAVKGMWMRRPSVRLQIPILAADVTSRKLFAGKHAPRFIHQKENVVEAIEWLVRKAKLNLTMLDSAFWGQAGSSAITLKIVQGKPVATVWPGRYCFPSFNDAEELASMMLAYCVTGTDCLNVGMNFDVHGKEIEASNQYWYVRIYDEKAVVTMKPIPQADWNPVTGDKNLLIVDFDHTAFHNLGFVPAVWIKNMPGGQGPDGRSTFRASLPNCVHLDYTLSQLGRGIHYSANPRLMVKGRILNFDAATGGTKVLDPNSILQLAPDKKNADLTSISGADAKFLEVTGAIVDVAMESFVTKIKQFTQELMSMNRKDPNTIDGAMSGKAMELIDEEFLDLVEVLKSTYGDEGILAVVIVLGKMCIAAKLQMFNGINEGSFETLKLEWPKMYTASPQEVNFLAQALNTAIKRPGTPATAPNKDGKGGAPATPDTGWMEEEDAIVYWENQIDKRSIIKDALKNEPQKDEKAPDIAPSGSDIANLPTP